MKVLKLLELRLKHPEFAPDGSWFKIAHEKDAKGIPTKLDEDIYFYVPNEVKFKDIKVGDKIELDDTFEVLEVGETLTYNLPLMRDRDDKNYLGIG